MAGGPEDGAVNSVDFLEDGLFFLCFWINTLGDGFFPWMKMLGDGFFSMDENAGGWICFLGLLG